MHSSSPPVYLLTHGQLAPTYKLMTCVRRLGGSRGNVLCRNTVWKDRQDAAAGIRKTGKDFVTIIHAAMRERTVVWKHCYVSHADQRSAQGSGSDFIGSAKPRFQPI